MPASEQHIAPGTITGIEAQKRNVQRVSIYIDETFAFGVHIDVAMQFDLKEGRFLDGEAQLRILRADAAIAARQRALDYLSRRARSVWEMRRYLRRKEFQEEVIADVIQELKQEGLLDDAAYAAAFVEERFRMKGHGPRRIRYDLRKRGVAAQWIDPAVEALREKQDLRAAARDHAERRWPRLVRSEKDPRRRRKKMYDYLRRRGFEYDIIRDVVECIETRYDEDS